MPGTPHSVLTPRPVAIVTGASRGLGAVIATRLAVAGYDLAVMARSAADLDALALSLASHDVSVLVVPVDLADAEAREYAVARALARFGQVDVLVNNAAVFVPERFDSVNPRDLENSLAVNLSAPVHLTRLVVAPMVTSGCGRVVNISSMMAYVPTPRGVVYSTAKAGLEQFTRTLNKDLAGTGVSASCLTLGAIPDVGQTVDLAARSGAELPAMIRRTSPSADKVAERVLRVVRTGREAQFAVPGARMMIRHPKLAARLMRLNGMAGFLEQTAAASCSASTARTPPRRSATSAGSTSWAGPTRSADSLSD